ncbi:MAG: DNA repair putative endonuclease MmcB [Aquisalinus sp.]|nr:DNA repair putative endonuclease MmcB [Aquisalinus sp.]
MQNDLIVEDITLASQSLRPDATLQVTRGARRLLGDMGYAVLTELHLPNARRADIAGLNSKGHLLIVEVKSCREDFMVDTKWPDYANFCDMFFFAVNPAFPRDILPEDQGLILADQFGAAIMRQAEEMSLKPARRKALTLSFARQAAHRLARTESCI